jgi:FkbM family methyltransferase
VDNYEPDVHAALLHFLKPGAIFLDCGANIGYFSVLAGGVVGTSGRVLAIEANPVTLRLLERNLALNGFGTAVHCALTSAPGEVELFVPREGGDVYSSLRKGGLIRGEDVEVIRVQGRTLEDVVASLGVDRVDVLKIDIEGGELDVLRSAKGVLQTMRPVVVCEYGTSTWPAFGATVQGLLQLLAECNYSAGVFDVEQGLVRPVDDQVWNSPYANLILEPSPSPRQ